jgi:hypothetical protein
VTDSDIAFVPAATQIFCAPDGEWSPPKWKPDVVWQTPPLPLQVPVFELNFLPISPPPVQSTSSPPVAQLLPSAFLPAIVNAEPTL